MVCLLYCLGHILLSGSVLSLDSEGQEVFADVRFALYVIGVFLYWLDLVSLMVMGCICHFCESSHLALQMFIVRA
ncbi:hypothetical protein KC19_4G172800 [Ceratodon purpureus]|uniref:Uncharacterized protein n=1 Tax=Ceratodon purpureus TaxID=3225 RepID=A0A8T0IC59_CERPU|nr:hypothetical protein KC19_4G172800 [Ceratodon purpureus]